MDPKQPTAQLDPKLKEAYDRVMNTPVAAPSSPVPPQPAATQPVLQTYPQSSPTIIAGTAPIVNTHRESEKIHIGSVTGAAPKKKSGGVPVILYIIGILIFLIVYTIFWLKFFKIPVPYVPF